MAAKHTKGPWAVGPTSYPSMIEVVGPNKQRVAGPFVLLATNQTWQEADEQLANAALIAAAPDYHAAVEEVRVAFQNNGAPYNLSYCLAQFDDDHMLEISVGLVKQLLAAHEKAGTPIDHHECVALAESEVA